MQKQSNVGKVVVNVWGYSMTLVDFYLIVSETEKRVGIVKLSSIDTQTGFLSGTSVPNLVNKEEDMKKVAQFTLAKTVNPFTGAQAFKGTLKGDYVKSFMDEWDGKPKRFNHCD